MFNVGAFTKDLIEHVIIIGLPKSALPTSTQYWMLDFYNHFHSLWHTQCAFIFNWIGLFFFHSDSYRSFLFLCLSLSYTHKQTLRASGGVPHSPSSLSFGQNTLDRFKLLQWQRCVSAQPSKPTQSKRVSMSTSSAPFRPTRTWLVWCGNMRLVDIPEPLEWLFQVPRDIHLDF